MKNFHAAVEICKLLIIYGKVHCLGSHAGCLSEGISSVKLRFFDTFYIGVSHSKRRYVQDRIGLSPAD